VRPADGPADAPAAAGTAPAAGGDTAVAGRDTSAAGGTPDGAREPDRIDLNRAGASELDALPGIGPVLARRIVEHRRQHGPFRSLEELRAVRGLGPRLLERLRPRVKVGDRP
jgi:competence protein ComEA